MSHTPDAPPPTRAYYARGGSRAADFWTLLHPPYTAWNLSYAAIGAALAPHLDGLRLALVLAAFLGGTGLASHALDELNGRPLRTGFSDRALWAITASGFALSLVASIWGAVLISPWILAWMLAGGVLVAAYSLEWWGGIVHSAAGFALAWGAFPLLAGYWAQAETLSWSAILAAVWAALTTLLQRALSTPARTLRRHHGQATVRFVDQPDWDTNRLLATWEKPLRLAGWSMVVLAVAMVIGRISLG